MHNPRALHPLPTGWFGAPLEERLEEGQIVSRFAEPFLPFMSMTMNFPGDTPTHVVQKVVDNLIAKLRAVMRTERAFLPEKRLAILQSP